MKKVFRFVLFLNFYCSRFELIEKICLVYTQWKGIKNTNDEIGDSIHG